VYLRCTHTLRLWPYGTLQPSRRTLGRGKGHTHLRQLLHWRNIMTRVASQLKPLNIWLGPVSLRNRKSCPQCHSKLTGDNCIVQGGEYIRSRFYLAFHACKLCLEKTLEQQLSTTRPIEYKVRVGHSIPWLRSN
jgi:hypothetical protein